MRLIEIALIVGSMAVFVVVKAKDAPPQDAWQIRRGGAEGQVHFRIERREGWRRHWSSGRDISWDRLTGITAATLDRGGKISFAYAADAGTIECQGEARFGRAQGTFRFRRNPAFAAELAQLGYSSPPGDSELFSAVMHGITLEFARTVAGSGLTANYHDLERMAIHGIDAAYIRDVAAQGYVPLRADDLVKARIHGIDAEYLGEVKKAGYDLPMDRIVEMKIHGVSPAYLRGLKNAGLRPDARELIEMRNHGVEPEFLKTLADSGYKELPARDVIELRIHGVSPRFIQETRAAGYQFNVRELTELRMHGVDGRYLARLAESGFQRLPVREIVKLKSHGID